MTTSEPVPADRSARDVARQDRAGWVGLAVLVLLAAVGLLWAKWAPYAGKAQALGSSGAWPDPSILTRAAGADHTPSLAGAWAFTSAYFLAVWRALLVAVLVAAAVDALVPRRWLLRALDRHTRTGQSIAGAALSLPSMMCTCCTAPVAVGLRRRGAPLTATVAYWVGNPLLNPAVLVFLLLVLPWPFAAVRLVVGLALVLALPAVIRLATTGRRVREAPLLGAPVLRADVPDDDARTVAELPLRYVRSLARFALVLVPEYVLVVLAVGLVSGWLPDDPGAVPAHLAAGAVVLVALVATLLVVPTGGEIPVIASVAALAVGPWLGGVLLIALPAVSLPSAAMVGRALGWRVTCSVLAATVVASLLAGALVAASS